MKLKPQIYAKMLIGAIEEKSDPKKTAQNFWFLLQKNKQYKELKNILDGLDHEIANRSNKILVKAFSAANLNENEIAEISRKIKKTYGRDSNVKNIVKPGLDAGVIIKIDDQEIDLSLRGKANRLQKILIKDTLE